MDFSSIGLQWQGNTDQHQKNVKIRVHRIALIIQLLFVEARHNTLSSPDLNPPESYNPASQIEGDPIPMQVAFLRSEKGGPLWPASRNCPSNHPATYAALPKLST